MPEPKFTLSAHACDWQVASTRQEPQSIPEGRSRFRPAQTALVAPRATESCEPAGPAPPQTEGAAPSRAGPTRRLGS